MTITCTWNHDWAKNFRNQKVMTYFHLLKKDNL